jgi:hypothetical protein
MLKKPQCFAFEIVELQGRRDMVNGFCGTETREPVETYFWDGCSLGVFEKGDTVGEEVV